MLTIDQNQGSREHILVWVGMQPHDEVFNFYDCQKCACGRYSHEYELGKLYNPESNLRAWAMVPNLAVKAA